MIWGYHYFRKHPYVIKVGMFPFDRINWIAGWCDKNNYINCWMPQVGIQRHHHRQLLHQRPRFVHSIWRDYDCKWRVGFLVLNGECLPISGTQTTLNDSTLQHLIRWQLPWLYKSVVHPWLHPSWDVFFPIYIYIYKSRVARSVSGESMTLNQPLHLFSFCWVHPFQIMKHHQEKKTVLTVTV